MDRLHIPDCIWNPSKYSAAVTGRTHHG